MKLGRAPTMQRILVKRRECYHQRLEKPTRISGGRVMQIFLLAANSRRRRKWKPGQRPPRARQTTWAPATTASGPAISKA